MAYQVSESRNTSLCQVLPKVTGDLIGSVGIDEQRGAGAWDVAWDGADADGRAVASGVYVVRLEAAHASDQRRAVIVR